MLLQCLDPLTDRYGLVRDLLSAVTIHDLWREIAASTGEGENHQIERQLELRGRLVLMKLADGMINDSILDLKGLRIECFVSTMKDLIDEKVQAALSTASTFNTEEVEGIASLLQLHLEIFKTLFQPDHNPNISSKESISLTGLLTGIPPIPTKLTSRIPGSFSQIYSSTRLNLSYPLRHNYRVTPLVNHRSLQRHQEGHHRSHNLIANFQ